MIAGAAFHGDGWDIFLAGANPTFITGCRTESQNFVQSAGGQPHITSCAYNLGNPSGGTFLWSNWSAIVENCTSDYGVITGFSNGVLYFRSSLFPPGFLSTYPGHVAEYNNLIDAIPRTVGNLLSPSPSIAGIRTFVTNSTVASTGNFGVTVAGGGTNTVPVFCDGVSWRIG